MSWTVSTQGSEESVIEQSEPPRFLHMVGLVALIVAVVILVFFGIGYAFGRMFL